ncbi:ImmA/IrrE family metallo-endopeptidase, partial [bacterium]
ALASSAKAIGADEASTWLRTLPLKQMRDDGWISTEKDHSTTLQSVLAFFNVSTPQEWEARYTDFANSFAFRTSPSFESKAGALAAWLRRAELRARAQQTRPWSEKNFRAALVEIRRLTRSKSPEKFLPKLQAICATAGVATVVLKSPAGCRASGASRFLSADKAMMILSFRYLSDDHFWFTFFHEAAHLILHQTRKPFVDTDDIESDPREDEANSFAAGVLIPENRQEEMGNLPARADNIIRFAVSAGVSPGVVVGQLQHRKMLGLQQMNGLKRRYTWDQITETTITQ